MSTLDDAKKSPRLSKQFIESTLTRESAVTAPVFRSAIGMILRGEGLEPPAKEEPKAKAEDGATVMRHVNEATDKQKNDKKKKHD